MSDTSAISVARATIDEFTGSTPAELDGAFRRLAAEFQADGSLRPDALAGIPALLDALDTVPPAHQARLALLLGLLAEAAGPDGGFPAHEAVRAGLDRYLRLLSDGGTDAGRGAALFFLLGHFPEDGARILAALPGTGVDQDDLSRLARCLQPWETADAATRWNLGRVFPSPAVWGLTEQERATAPALDQWLGLPAERTAELWATETRALLAYSGAKAVWACEHGATVSPFVVPAPEEERTAEPSPAADVLRGHARAVRCPRCRQPLAGGTEAAVCTGCEAVFPSVDGLLDFHDQPSGPSDPLLAGRYERGLRAGFVRIMGANWGGWVSLDDEDAYLSEHVRPVDGPVLDLAAGAGRWTRVLARSLGEERVIALDLSAEMLAQLRAKLDRVLTVRGSALELPFEDASLGGVNCWNALQAIPDPERAIREVGRCLRPGGTFTVMTFRQAADPLYRQFQSRLERQAHRGSFDPEQLTGWLADAGMTVRDLSGPGNFLFVTAAKA
ncbi:class I SAM-dependent methyltransferase [Kitasatospora sp. MY 5-36]|uniref:class I SAM-dependent methyltransferase n=1 Tax=Kitasatospora sp. MY 5-36 TaxID=1678027 RepID=UPI000670B8A7|nr:class I SAM-dependent methyltransferase [Kitasatospora sp. MY 5-36]